MQNDTHSLRNRYRYVMAEKVGFEPTRQLPDLTV